MTSGVFSGACLPARYLWNLLSHSSPGAEVSLGCMHAGRHPAPNTPKSGSRRCAEIHSPVLRPTTYNRITPSTQHTLVRRTIQYRGSGSAQAQASQPAQSTCSAAQARACGSRLVLLPHYKVADQYRISKMIRIDLPNLGRRQNLWLPPPSYILLPWG